MALPTFERESDADARPARRVRARRPNPLITQLRPAARELSPTLQDLGALSPDLERAVPRARPADHGVARPASRRPSSCSRTRGRCIAQLDPAMRQLTPILEFLGLYKRELTSFFANTVAATQARTTRAAKIHYLRTTNPLNPENLAVYPRRIGTNRPNAYTKPGNFTQLARACRCSTTATAAPAIPIGHQRPAAAAAADRRRPRARTSCSTTSCTFAFAGTNGGAAAAPPCRLAGPVHVQRRDHAVPARPASDDAGLERIVRASARRPASRAGRRRGARRRGLRALALRLEPSAATDTLVGRGADTYKATERYRERFGDHSVIVLVARRAARTCC